MKHKVQSDVTLLFTVQQCTTEVLYLYIHFCTTIGRSSPIQPNNLNVKQSPIHEQLTFCSQSTFAPLLPLRPGPVDWPNNSCTDHISVYCVYCVGCLLCMLYEVCLLSLPASASRCVLPEERGLSVSHRPSSQAHQEQSWKYTGEKHTVPIVYTSCLCLDCPLSSVNSFYPSLWPEKI